MDTENFSDIENLANNRSSKYKFWTWLEYFIGWLGNQ